MTTADLVLEKLQQFKLKSEGANKWRCNSPLRPGSDSHAFTFTVSENGEHGAYKDHVTGENGSLYDLAQHLGLSIEPRTSTPLRIETTKRAYADMGEYARAHGVTAAVLESAGWREVDYKGRKALKFPTSGGDRLRFLDGAKPVYKSPPGYRACWYGLHRAIELASKAEAPALILCNGEVSTVVAHFFGIAACAITAGEQKAMREDLLAELKHAYPSGRIIVAMDCDPTGRNAAWGLAEQLGDEGYDAQTVDMGLDVGGDLADLCNLYRENAQQMLETLPPLPVQPLSQGATSGVSFRLLTLDELFKLPPQRWLIDKLIPEQGLITLYGASGEGKSFYALNLAMQVARDNLVVYIASEGEAGFKKRSAAWLQHNGVSASAERILFCMGSFSMLDSVDMEMFIEQLNRDHPALVIVDTIAQTMVGADENSARDMGKYIKGCKDLQRGLGCAVALIHHIGKSRSDERGSSALRASCDVMIRLVAEDDIIRIECSKTKDEAPFPPSYFRLLPVSVAGIGDSVVAVPATKVMRGPNDALTDKQQTFLDLLNSDVYSEGTSLKELEETADIKHGSGFRAIETLINRKLVEHADRGVYRITDKGRALIKSSDQSDHIDRSIDHPLITSQTEQKPDSHGTEKASDRFDRSDHIASPGSDQTPDQLHDQSDQSDQTKSKAPDVFSGKRDSYYSYGG